MAAGATADADQSVGAARDRLAGMQRVDDVAEYDAAIAVNRLDGAAWIAKTGDDKRYLVRDDDLKVGLVARVGAMHDEIDGVRGDFCRRMRRLVGVQIGLDVGEPAIELLRRPGVDMREGADNAGAAQRRHQGRKGNEKHRRA